MLNSPCCCRMGGAGWCWSKQRTRRRGLFGRKHKFLGGVQCGLRVTVGFSWYIWAVMSFCAYSKYNLKIFHDEGAKRMRIGFMKLSLGRRDS